MSGRAGAIPLSFLCGALILAACTDIPTGANEVLAFEFDPLPSPAVVAGDSLRDSLGVVKPLTLKAFNYQGGEVTGLPARFRAADRRARVDSVTGVVVGDSAGTTTRIIATVSKLTGSLSLAVVPRPDTIVGSNARDSLSYSLSDTAANVSQPMGVRIFHGAAGDTAVASWRVNFHILSPADTAFVRLVADNGEKSQVDTTDASGVAQRRIKLNVLHIGSSLSDSVIVEARATYRGANVKGSPVRLVLRFKPK